MERQAVAAEKGKERKVAALQAAIDKNREMQDEIRETLRLTQAIRDMKKVAIQFSTNAGAVYNQIRALFNPPPKPGGYDADPKTPWPMAEGGIVTRPTLALLGERNRPEAVIPLDKAGGYGGITLNYAPAYSTASPEEARRFADEVGPSIARWMRDSR